ncbi:unnamed protein product [Microthlaspi erraticum]|uniref:TFIIS N-terminal domain-containing protein n=1 Tax=Microthlaspi erraticum TaxID=1685480 RepID=A0A6D2LIW5_9BRAS|nr:unnamed protein product [Microthlaspi erraticum]
MAIMTPSAALDSWRDYFRRGHSDIFRIIDNAIMVAAADFPTEFKSRRIGIAELLFTCKTSLCVGCDHLALSIPGDEDAAQHDGLKTAATVEVGGGGDGDGSVIEDETKLNENQIAGNDSSGEGEVEGLSDELEACAGIVDEIMMIKAILMNEEEEPESVILESLRKLDLMTMTVDLLQETEIGKTVNGLRKHSSSRISQLAKSLLTEWKELVNNWINTTKKDIAGGEGTPESNFSVIDEIDAFPSPPHDVHLYVPDPINGMNFSEILDGFDLDVFGNFVEFNDDGSLVSGSGSWEIPEGTNEANVVERNNEDQQMEREEAVVRPVVKHSETDVDEPRKRPKQSREQQQQVVPPAVQRKPHVVAGPQQNVRKLNSVDSEAKFEVASRKLQERYQQHENAKRQRTIQVLETIPKQSKPKKPPHKRTGRRF